MYVSASACSGHMKSSSRHFMARSQVPGLVILHKDGAPIVFSLEQWAVVWDLTEGYPNQSWGYSGISIGFVWN